MTFEEAVKLTQSRLAEEGGTMGDLFSHSKSWTSPDLVGKKEWGRLLNTAETLPVTMGAFPFGFEFPLHTLSPEADFGVSLTGGTRTSEIFRERAEQDSSDQLANAIVRLLDRMEGQDSSLRELVGQKIMLEFDIGSAGDRNAELPGFFLRPGKRPIGGRAGQTEDVITVSDALVHGVGWQLSGGERRKLQQIYAAQTAETRMDSFGVFPSRSRGIRLAVMGFSSQEAVGSFLAETEWPGDISQALAVVSRFEERAAVARNGVNLDVQDGRLGPALGLTAMVKQRFTNDPRYWIDDPSVWAPYLDALRQEEIVFNEKIDALSGWVSQPQMLYGKTGRFILLRGIHHVKLVISEGRVQKAKAYVFMVLSAESPA